MKMQSDEESLYDPEAADESTQVLDAAAGRVENSGGTPSTATAHSSRTSSNHSDDSTNKDDVTADSNNTTLNTTTRKRWFILEPAVFLVFLAMYLSGAVYQNQILYQTCVAIYKYNESDCQPLLGVSRETKEAQEIETRVQPYVARILMARSLLESIIPAFVSLFVGPWSDKFGRRPIIVATYTGYLTGCIILTVLAFIASKVVISPWLFLLSSVPSVLSGGTCALITGIYCYISDVAKEKARAVRMVMNEASLLAGMMAGNVLSGYVYAATNVVTVFGISALLMLLALLYVFIFVVESLRPDQIHTGSKVREFFRFDLVKDLVHTCFERRPSFDRAIIWLTMITLTIALFTMEGDSNVTYLFFRAKFEWTLKDYTLFNAARIVVQIIGSIFALILLRKVLKVSIVSMTMLSLACCVLESTVRATAMYWWELYLGMILGGMRGIMGPMARAILSHVAPPTEVGKIFAFTTSLESLSPLGAAPLYTTVYNMTLEFYPGIFNFISAGLYTLCFTLIAVIYGIQKSLGNTAAYQAIGS
ncbi:proton-coupled folate transporter-like [Anastrepha ludens]|uniref:proton-coupled folate transporter-like n=1 Tax=Anastrepha ludens TaxID=28586 RepID=UPI0023B0EE24|nr:proton-coupled folate transporter-like [Anastrepha ludens]